MAPCYPSDDERSCNDSSKGKSRKSKFSEINGFKNAPFTDSSRFILEEYKDPNGELIPLHTTSYQNGYNHRVDKNSTMPRSNLSGYYYSTSLSSDDNHIPNHDDDMLFRQSQRDCSRGKIRSRNISAVSIAIAALFLCIGALVIGVLGIVLQPEIDLDPEGTSIPFEPNLFDEVGRFIVRDYDIQTPFSDFLPGLAGIYGKPLYAFFVNRGQGIASFGVDSKQTPIMEFSPANVAYQNTPLVGFRTFIQGRRGTDGGPQDVFVVEPFSPITTNFPPIMDDNSQPSNERILYSGENEMQIQEVDYERQLETNVTYFILPEENFGAFVRRTTITNTHLEEPVTISFLDGLAKMQPAGGDLDQYLKVMGRTLEGFMGVHFPYNDTITMPFYRLSTRPADSDFIQEQERGHYCLSIKEDQNASILPIVFDGSKVFGEDTTLLRPLGLFEKTIEDIINEPQYGKAKTASCFAAVEDTTLQPGESVTITTYFGAANHILEVPVMARRLRQDGFALYKLTRTREVIRQITTSVQTKTGSDLFDAHVTQMYLDNSLRGGVPIVLGDQDDNNAILTVDEDPRLKVFHVFSRIHGDLERDYNDFLLPSNFFSQGPGNFRDVIQNRRNDAVFNPKIGSFNVRQFLSFIQADGYEPHSVEAVVFTIEDKALCDETAIRAVGPADGHRAQREALSGMLNNGPFRPGQLFNFITEQNIFLIVSRQEFIDMVAMVADSNPFAVYKEGFWADHWTYYLDMIESYLSIFPEEEERVMFDVTLPYFFSPASVQPRSKKYVKDLSYDGIHNHIQQLDATIDDEAKRDHMNQYIAKNIGWYRITAHWQHDQSGAIFESTIFGKLFLLVTLKFATRDALGMGIEYEAGRPGWDDANNGIPGMLGSGMSETFELKALLRFLNGCLAKHQRDFEIPEELHELYQSINENLSILKGTTNYNTMNTTEVPHQLFSYWDNVSNAREIYRQKTRITFSGVTVMLKHDEVVKSLELWGKELNEGIARARQFGTRGHNDDGTSGIVPTFFAYDVTEWNATGETNALGHPYVTPRSMSVVHFPMFLEGPTRMMKTVNKKAAKKIYSSLRNSTLYDKNLNMFLISASLQDQPIEMGRSAAFAQGWLENQSVWLHMSYKFYLELLRHRLYDDFFYSMQEGGMLPFVNVETYGRSPMQCSSFIASSVFEDPAVRGRGFLGRLSGATAEFLSMWILMFIGPDPFYVAASDGELRMKLTPTLPRWLFHVHDGLTDIGGVIVDDDGTPRISFKLFSSINVHYYNPRNVDLFGVPPSRYRVGLRDGTVFDFHQSFIPSDMARKIRRVVFVDYIEAHFD